MSIIRPFKGYRPPSNLAYKISSPPYDVMTSNEAREMVSENPDSFIRIIKPEVDFSYEEDLQNDNLHFHGRKNLINLIKNNKLIQDNNPCFYLYQITMGAHTQTGIVATVSVDEYNQGVIKKHEYTRSEKEDDRTLHIEITNANTGPVFLTYRNDGKLKNALLKIINSHPDVSFRADDTTLHTLWKISNEIQIEKLIDYFKTISSFYIADGHHRAASASRVQKIKKDANPNHTGNESYNYFLSVIFPDDEMKILDYNRVIKNLNGLSEVNFIEKIKENFEINLVSNFRFPLIRNNYFMFLNGKWYQLISKMHIRSDDPVEGLEASILQKYLLDPILNIDNPRTNTNIDFVGGIRGMEELERRCQIDCSVAFALPPVSIDQLLLVADSGKVMPPKSTWFEPKLRSGLVVHLLED